MCMDFLSLAYVRGNDFSTISANNTSHHFLLTDVYVRIKALDSFQEIDHPDDFHHSKIVLITISALCALCLAVSKGSFSLFSLAL